MQQPNEADLPLLAQRTSPHAYMQERHAIVAHAQKAMEAARQRMAAQVDPHRQELTFQAGDLVSLKTKHLMVNTLPSKKLFPKWIGPMRVQQVINPAAYMLELPRTWRAHNVFHVSLLKPYMDNGEVMDPVPYTLIGGADNEVEVEVISDFKPKAPKRTGQLRKVSDPTFHVKWLGLDWGVDAWQPWGNLKGTCDDALTALATKYRLPADIFHKGTHLRCQQSFRNRITTYQVHLQLLPVLEPCLISVLTQSHAALAQCTHMGFLLLRLPASRAAHAAPKIAMCCQMAHISTFTVILYTYDISTARPLACATRRLHASTGRTLRHINPGTS